MIKTPKGLRLHIGVFGRRNVGKSSVLNALVGQNVSIVSDVAGTTTDPVEKVMELKPIGPVVFIDTAGVDDTGDLGEARIAQTGKVADRTELAILVTDDWTDYERKLLELFEQHNVPVVVVANKSDLREGSELEQAAKDSGVRLVVRTCATTGTGIDQLRDMVINATPEEFLEAAPIIADLVSAGDMVVLVTPIDIEAPKGRLKMLQVHCMREILDKNACAMVVKETDLAGALSRLSEPPALVICDSQVLDKVAAIVPSEVGLTTFSILMALYKGDFEAMIEGTKAIESLAVGSRVLIAEACTHHPIGDDIGREQIPRLLKEHVGGELTIDVAAGRDFPQDLEQYELIIHCGACVFNKKELLNRIQKAKLASVPITNYGMVIAYLNGLLERALEPYAGLGEAGIRADQWDSRPVGQLSG